MPRRASRNESRGLFPICEVSELVYTEHQSESSLIAAKIRSRLESAERNHVAFENKCAANVPKTQRLVFLPVDVFPCLMAAVWLVAIFYSLLRL